MKTISLFILFISILFIFVKCLRYLKKENILYKYLTILGILYLIDIALASFIIDYFSLFEGLNSKYDFEEVFYTILLWSYLPIVLLIIIGSVWWLVDIFYLKKKLKV